MSGPYTGILKHSGIYSAGQLLARLASILLLPVYTRYLSPADYGCIAVLDLTTSLLAILIGSGIAAALSRYHFEARDESGRDRTWWTGLTIIAATATIVVMPSLWARSALERLVLGPGHQAGTYLALALPTLWFGVLIQVLEAYLRVHKWSLLFVGLSLARLVLNVACNLYFLAGSQMGVHAILAGNLIAAVVMTIALAIVFAVHRGPYTFDTAAGTRLWKFGGPLVLMALLAAVMHQADRYLLRLFSVDLERVGVYALAYAMGQAVSTLYLTPFASIWIAAIYEIASRPDAKFVYARIFEFFFYGSMLVTLAVSLFAEPLLAIVAPASYAAAAELLPIICLAYVFFGLIEHFKVPALLAKRTVDLLPAGAAGAATNIGLNCALIPLLGPAGAAWSSVATFATFSGIALWRCRKINTYDYPFAKCGLVMLGMIASYCLLKSIRDEGAVALASAALWVGWAAVLFGPLCWRLLGRRTFPDWTPRTVPGYSDRS